MPLYRYFCNRDTELLGEKKKLNIKYPGRKMLSGEYLLSRRTREKLEPTLGITDVTNSHNAEDGVQPVHQNIPQ